MRPTSPNEKDGEGKGSIGSSFEEFLEDQGTRTETVDQAEKRVLAFKEVSRN